MSCKFNVVVIKHHREEKYFVAKIPSFSKLYGKPLIQNFLDYENKESKQKVYKGLVEYVKNEGIHRMVVKREELPLTKEEADINIYKYQKIFMKKHGDECILNDIVISQEKYRCQCGNIVREQFRTQHDEKYCSYKSFEEITDEELLNIL